MFFHLYGFWKETSTVPWWLMSSTPHEQSETPLLTLLFWDLASYKTQTDAPFNFLLRVLRTTLIEFVLSITENSISSRETENFNIPTIQLVWKWHFNTKANFDKTLCLTRLPLVWRLMWLTSMISSHCHPWLGLWNNNRLANEAEPILLCSFFLSFCLKVRYEHCNYILLMLFSLTSV